jgi:hypothetical protein
VQLHRLIARRPAELPYRQPSTRSRSSPSSLLSLSLTPRKRGSSCIFSFLTSYLASPSQLQRACGSLGLRLRSCLSRLSILPGLAERSPPQAPRSHLFSSETLYISEASSFLYNLLVLVTGFSLSLSISRIYIELYIIRAALERLAFSSTLHRINLENGWQS